MGGGKDHFSAQIGQLEFPVLFFSLSLAAHHYDCCKDPRMIDGQILTLVLKRKRYSSGNS